MMNLMHTLKFEHKSFSYFFFFDFILVLDPQDPLQSDRAHRDASFGQGLVSVALRGNKNKPLEVLKTSQEDSG